MERHDIHFFDKTQGHTVFDHRCLPHWLQAGTLCFITWRVADSLPREVLAALDTEVERMLATEGLERDFANSERWRAFDAKRRGQIHWKLFRIRDKYLDHGLGRCPLRNPANAAIVKESLLHFDQKRYFLTDVVIMPNHVHLIAAFADEEGMLNQCASWKRFSGRAINVAEGRSGEFWQVDQFDHLIRGESQFEYFRRYIRNNPEEAGLGEEEFLWWQSRLGGGS